MIDPVLLSGSAVVAAFGAYYGYKRPLNRKRKPRPPHRSFAKILIIPHKPTNKETPKK